VLVVKKIGAGGMESAAVVDSGDEFPGVIK
jgi:hypothetical protein